MADNTNTPAPAPVSDPTPADTATPTLAPAAPKASKGKAKTYTVAPFKNTGDFNPTAHILNGIRYTPGQQVELDSESDAELIKSLQAAKIIEA